MTKPLAKGRKRKKVLRSSLAVLVEPTFVSFTITEQRSLLFEQLADLPQEILSVIVKKLLAYILYIFAILSIKRGHPRNGIAGDLTASRRKVGGIYYGSR